MLIVIVLVIGAIVGIAIAAGVRRRSWRSEPPYPPERGPYPGYGPGYGRQHGYGPGYGAGYGPGYGQQHGYGPQYRDPGYDGYGRPHHSGMHPGAAGAIGAVGGGLLGYELGKMEGEQDQFRQDQAMERREEFGPYGAEQGGWVVDQDPGMDGGWGWDNGGW